MMGAVESSGWISNQNQNKKDTLFRIPHVFKGLWCRPRLTHPLKFETALLFKLLASISLR